jgi:outer membrane protein
MRAKLLLGTALALLPFLSASGETIEETMIKAYLTNPTLAAERAQLRVTDENLPQALALRRPTITGQGDVGATYQNTNTTGSEGLTPRDVSIGVTQPLWTGGRADAAISQAEYLVLAQRANLLNTEELVLLQAATAHLDVVRDQTLLDLANNNVKVLAQSRDEAKAQLAAGVATKTDLAQAEARLAQGIADQRRSEANLTNSRANYLQAQPPPPVQAMPVSEDVAVKQATELNPQVLTAQANEQAARAGVDVAQAQLMPTLGVSATLLHEKDVLIRGTRDDSAQVLLTLTVPLYQAGAEYSRIRAAKESYGVSQNQIEAAIRVATLNATQSWQNLEAAQANIKSFTSQIEANTIAYSGVVEEQRVGTRTLLDVLNAQQELFTSQSNLAIAQHDDAVSAYQVKTAVGEMTALALNLQVDRYNPQKHYDAVRDKWIGTGPVAP